MVLCFLAAFKHVRCARLGSEKQIYPIKQRKLVTTVITENELQDFMLTFSFDSPPKRLQPFSIDLRTTDGALPISALNLVAEAMNQFVQDILQGQFLQYQEVKTVNTIILGQNAFDTFDGSTLETAINVTFKTEPSPPTSLVEQTLESLMTDQRMDEYVSILNGLAGLAATESEARDSLENVTQASRTSLSSNEVEGIRATGSGEDGEFRAEVIVVVPAIIATGLLLAGMALLVSKLKKKEDDPEAVSEIRKVDLLVDDEESDIFSFEAALSPSNSEDALSPETVASIETPENKVFVEIDSEAQSPGGRSLLSFFSGVLGEHRPLGEAERQKRQSMQARAKTKPIITPSARLSPLLYAFSDDEEEDLLSSSESGLTSDSMQESPSPSQPYDAITLDELLVEKYSTHDDVDIVSPVHGITSPAWSASNGQPLEVSTNQDQRTIIAAAPSPLVSPKPAYYAQSPKKPSPLISPKPPLYKASPNSKAPAVTAASPQKPASSTSVFEGCPDMWSVVSPSSALKLNNAGTDCCPTPRSVNKAATHAPPNASDQSRGSRSAIPLASAPPRVSRSAQKTSPQKRTDTSPAPNGTPPRIDRGSPSSSPQRRADVSPAAHDVKQKTNRDVSSQERADESPAANDVVHGFIRAKSMSPPKRSQKQSASTSTTPRFQRNVKSMSPPKRKASVPSPETQSVEIWGQKKLSSPRTAKSPGDDPGMRTAGPVTGMNRWSSYSSDNITVKAKNGSMRQATTPMVHGEKLSSKKPDPWKDSSSHGSDPWSSSVSLSADPWDERVSVNHATTAMRLSRSASPRYSHQPAVQPPNEIWERPEFVRSREYSERFTKSESPSKRVKRSGKQPPVEIWNQPLFSQEKMSRDILSENQEISQHSRLSGAARARSESPKTSVSRHQHINNTNSDILDHNAVSRAGISTHLSPLATQGQPTPQQRAPHTTPHKWSFESVVTAAAKAASSVGLSFGEPRYNEDNGNVGDVERPFADDVSYGSDDKVDFQDHYLASRDVETLSETASTTYSPEMAYIAANSAVQSRRKGRSLPANFADGSGARAYSPGWLSRARAGLRRSSPRKSIRSPVHDKATQGEVATKRLRTSDEPLRRVSNTKALKQRSPRGRRHARYSAVDGSTDYQAMLQHRDPNMSSFDAVSLSDSADSSPMDSRTPRSINGSYFPNTPMSLDDSALDSRDGQKLLMDLVWLEKKIAGQRPDGAQRPSSPFSFDNSSYTGLSELSQTQQHISQLDSMSFTSLDGNVESEVESVDPRPGPDIGAMSSIVCRDCYAPPGKLRIIIHSTKDGPAVHTVKKGSSLEGHVFPGDLIVSIDDNDTRAFTAEQVMRMMAAREGEERKITVLHFEKDSNPGAKRQRKA